MRRYLTAVLVLTLFAASPAWCEEPPAAAPFNAAQRLTELQQRFTLNRERAAALDMAAQEMQKQAEALQEVLRLTAPMPETKPVTSKEDKP